MTATKKKHRLRKPMRELILAVEEAKLVMRHRTGEDDYCSSLLNMVSTTKHKCDCGVDAARKRLDKAMDGVIARVRK